MIANQSEMLMSKLEKETLVMQQQKPQKKEEEGKMQEFANNNDLHCDPNSRVLPEAELHFYSNCIIFDIQLK